MECLTRWSGNDRICALEISGTITPINDKPRGSERCEVGIVRLESCNRDAPTSPPEVIDQKNERAAAMESTILVAEDDPELADLYQCYLARCGYRVLTASGGVECLSIIRNDPPAVIVASVNLPWSGTDGLMDCLHEEFLQRRIPSVILTGSTADENVAELREEPCVFRYLRKPFLMGRLLDCIRAIESDVSGDERSTVRVLPRQAACS